MRAEADADKVRRFMRRLGEEARGPGAVYFTGGASAVLVGWRESTLDVDVRLDPEPPGVFDAIARLKDELELNVELASPQDFLPELAGWKQRSRPVGSFGPVAFLHYDFVAQALAKAERGHALDVADVRAMLERGLVEPAALRAAFEEIEPRLKRFPAVDPASFRRRLLALLEPEERP